MKTIFTCSFLVLLPASLNCFLGSSADISSSCDPLSSFWVPSDGSSGVPGVVELSSLVGLGSCFGTDSAASSQSSIGGSDAGDGLSFTPNRQ